MSALILFKYYVWLILMFKIESHSIDSNKYFKLRLKTDTQVFNTHSVTQFIR